MENKEFQKESKAIATDTSGTSKVAFTYEGRTGIAETEGFRKKGLAQLACNIGNICEFGCTYCYVPTITTKQRYVQRILKQGYTFDQVSSYRTRDNLMKCLERDLRKISPGDNRTVFFCTTCDPCATEEHAGMTSEAIRLIMESSDLQVRVLSKSVLILDLAEALESYRQRIIYGLSTGTIRPKISGCIEEKASPLEKRFETLRLLQVSGYRTYGMLCPILPSEMPYVGELIDAVNPSCCEHIWAEAINVRGKSLEKTRDRLASWGLGDDAKSLQMVMGRTGAWNGYSTLLFLKVRTELSNRGCGGKLSFLQYVKGMPPTFRKLFESKKGAVCL